MPRQLQMYLGDHPDFSLDHPTGRTETYIPGNDRHVELTVGHILAAEAVVAIAGSSGLSATGDYVPLFDAADFTVQQHNERYIVQQHIEAQQA